MQKAGKHMEDSVVAAYVALLLGCIVQENEVSVMCYIEIGVYTIDRDVWGFRGTYARPGWIILLYPWAKHLLSSAFLHPGV